MDIQYLGANIYVWVLVTLNLSMHMQYIDVNIYIWRTRCMLLSTLGKRMPQVEYEYYCFYFLKHILPEWNKSIFLPDYVVEEW